MSIVLDSGGVSALARRDRLTQARLAVLGQRGFWPPIVPTAVLVESLTGYGPRDALLNRLLRLATVHGLDEGLARRAALLRTTVRAGSAVDAVVVATAELLRAPALTGDVGDLATLAQATAGVVILPA